MQEGKTRKDNKENGRRQRHWKKRRELGHNQLSYTKIHD